MLALQHTSLSHIQLRARGAFHGECLFFNYIQICFPTTKSKVVKLTTFIVIVVEGVQRPPLGGLGKHSSQLLRDAELQYVAVEQCAGAARWWGEVARNVVEWQEVV